MHQDIKEDNRWFRWLFSRILDLGARFLMPGPCLRLKKRKEKKCRSARAHQFHSSSQGRSFVGQRDEMTG